MPQPYRTADQAGFTIVEMLVTIGILGLLVAIVLPAVQSSREQARNTQCLSNLHQIAVALNSHLSAKSSYPAGLWPGAVPRSDPGYSAGMLSTQSQLLPFLDQANLFNQLNLSIGFPATAIENTTVSRTNLDVFMCPSDTYRGSRGTSFRACVGPNPFLLDGKIGGGGAFSSIVPLSPQDISDGLVQTIGFSERCCGSGNGSTPNPKRDVWYSHLYSLGGPSSPDEMIASCSALTNPSPEVFLDSGRGWIFARLEDTLYNQVAPPNWTGMDCGAEGKPTLPYQFSTVGAFSARSYHLGKVNVFTMDGATKSVRDTISLPVWRALSSRSSGEVISGSDF